MTREDQLIRILLVTGDEETVSRLYEMLDAIQAANFIMDWACTLDEGLSRLGCNEYDACLLDDSLMAEGGLALLQSLHVENCQTPIILLTDEGHGMAGLAAMECGVMDYLEKETLTADRLERSLRYSIQRGRSNAALCASEEKYRLIVESATDYAIFTLDTQWRVTSWNSGAQRLLKYDEPEILGQRMDVIFTEEDRLQRRPEDDMREVLITGRTKNERWYQRKDGSRFWGVGIMVTQHDAAGNTVGYLKILQDITDRKRAEEALREANERLTDADQRKDEFLAMLAHELRNPLVPIRNAVQILRMIESTDPTAQRQKDVIDRQVTHMVRLVDDLLDVSRITRGKVKLQKERVIICDIVSQALEAIQPIINSRGQRLHVHLAPQQLHAEADPVRLIQVVTNLLNNATKYTDEGGQIWLTVEREDREALIKVRDSGAGIRQEMLSNVFNLFDQADRLHDRTQGGLGIGLYLVRQLVEMHNGRVQAWSAGAGQGSEFTISLPLLAGSIPGIPNEEPSLLATPEIAETEDHEHKILIVEDNMDAADSLAEMLEIWGQRVCVVYDGLTALGTALDFHPDIVLLDIGLPGINGYEVARRLRRERDLNGVFIVALTGYGQEEDRRQAMEAGFDRHFTKPVDLDVLHTLLKQVA